MEYSKNFNVRNGRNLTMLVDFYELTMGNGYLESSMQDTISYFDMFFRKVPDEGGFCIMAGVQQVIEYLSSLSFSDEDIEYLKGKGCFSDKFLNYLRDFEFSCDVWAVPEGTPVFPYEPILTVKGPAIQAQFVETMILLTINHQTLIATKANRICRAADGRPVMEFGSRRAHSYDAAIYGARAAVIGGCTSTACTIAEEMFGIPAVGTMAHSWIQLFDSEYDAFKAWAEVNPNEFVFLVDTYNTLKSGVPNAIRVFDEVLKPMGIRPVGIRIDSGDITYLTKKCRKMLNDAGYSDVKIVISNSLDEFIIRDVLSQGAAIDSMGVGERLITSKSEPVFGGVYKMCATENEKTGEITPKIKISDNEEKITNPGFKKVYRIFEKGTDMAMADLIAQYDEVIDESQALEIFDPVYTWKKKRFKNYYAKELLVQIFNKGKCIYESPDVMEIREFSKGQVEKLWPEMLRFERPQEYFVDLSTKLWTLKQELIQKHSVIYEE